MRKLEYVELHYTYGGVYGDKMICHYSGGLTKIHRWNQKADNAYLMHNIRTNGVFIPVYDEFCLDNNACHIVSFMHKEE